MWEWRTIARSPALLAQAWQTARKSSARSRSPARSAKSEAGDRRREAVVEGLGQPQRLVDAVPAQLDRELVRAQLAGVEEAEQLDPREVRLAERPELRRAVLVHVPGVVGLLRPGRRQGQQVRGRDVGDAAGRQHRLEVLEDRAGVLDVLDRLQEDDRVAGLGEALDQVALEAQVGPRVAQPRVLVRLGVGVDADHARRARRPARRSRSPRRRPCRRPACRRPAPRSTRRRPGGAGTSSSPRARRAASARRSAAAAAPRGAGRPGRIRAPRAPGPYCSRPDAGLPHRHPGAHQGRQHPLPRRGGRRIRRQVGHRLRRHRPGAGAAEAGQGARRASTGAASATRSRSAPAPATSRSTCCSSG